MRRTHRSSRRRSLRRRTRKSRAQGTAARLWSEWRVEIIVILLIAVGTFLLVERMQIRQTIIGWFRAGIEALGSLTQRSVHQLSDLVLDASLSQLLGFGLLLAGVVFVALRTRWRLMTMSRFTERACPRCSGELHRIRRRRIDRVTNLYVPVRRFQCKNPDCCWRGLRVGKFRVE